MKHTAFPNMEAERTAKGMTQKDLSQALGITPHTYLNYQSFGVIPSDKLVKMARMFNCSTDYLLGLTDNRGPAVIRA